MKHTIPDIAAKRFDYVNLDRSFLTFASEECGGIPAEELLETLEITIATEHHRATPQPISGHPRMIWELHTEHLIAQYQILPDRIEIGPIRSKTTGLPYEPYHDLLAEFAP